VEIQYYGGYRRTGGGLGDQQCVEKGECFRNPDASYDWNKQAGQQWFLQAARQRGVEKLLAFPNAPPIMNQTWSIPFRSLTA